MARAAKTPNPYRAREIILSGRRDYDARTIYDAGFLSAVLPADQLDGFVADRAAEIAKKDRKALRMAKELFDRSRDATSLEAALSLERLGIQWLNNTPEKLQMCEALAGDPEALLKAQKKNNG
ncbi:MAG: enoyl-CoA hydratase/isomerase family protein [Pseudodonghicola sp.]